MTTALPRLRAIGTSQEWAADLYENNPVRLMATSEPTKNPNLPKTRKGLGKPLTLGTGVEPGSDGRVI
jgi:hypothetical protein